MPETLGTVDFDSQSMVILGASGNVGTRLIERVTESDYPQGEAYHNSDLPSEKNPINHQHPTKIIAISDSKRFYVDLNGIPAELLRATEDTRANVKAILDERGQEHGGNLESIQEEISCQIEAQTGDQKIDEAHVGYVDLTDSKDAKALYKGIIECTRSSIVAVSKKVFGYATKEEFDAFLASGRVEYLPTVGAGMDAVLHLSEYPESRESLKEVVAMISGTNLAICKGFESEAYRKGEVEFSDLVRAAWKRGDTEPYADTDLGESESDTWVKARIMAMSAGLEARPENIKSGKPFVPKVIGERFHKDSMEDYLAAISAEVDADMRAYVEANVNDEFTLRHIARIRVDDDGTEEITVGLEQVRRDSRFATSRMNLIKIEDTTEPLWLEKPGAGRDTTSKSIERAFRRLVPRGLPRFK